MPGGIELTLEAEQYVDIRPRDRWLGVACGRGELELYLAKEHGCSVVGTDISAQMVARARTRAQGRGLDQVVSFALADGQALPFRSGAFDGVFCSGALCAFYDQGLDEFRRLLRPGGRAVVLDVVWRRDPVPEEVVRRWAGEDARVLTIDRNVQAMEEHGFHVLHASGYHEPSWWEAYYDDRGPGAHWQHERASYRADCDYLGVGLFVLGT